MDMVHSRASADGDLRGQSHFVSDYGRSRAKSRPYAIFRPWWPQARVSQLSVSPARDFDAGASAQHTGFLVSPRS
jgi:hypothetical protein